MNKGQQEAGMRTTRAVRTVIVMLAAGVPMAAQQAPSSTPAPRGVPLITDYVAASVGPVPPSLGFHPFYKKYTDALGIPVISSDKVPDAALLVARDIVNTMLSGRQDLREAMIARNWRVGIMAETEITGDIPEHANRKRPGAPAGEPPNEEDRQYWARRARGLGGNPTTGAEENLLRSRKHSWSRRRHRTHLTDVGVLARLS
jgi:hypothetical protein